MQSTYYFDDPDEGIARETSHPRFLELAREDFYYDCTDDFSPFGSDAGADTLSFLEEWYRNGGQEGEAIRFLNDVLAGWDLSVPEHLIRADPPERERWLSQENMHESHSWQEMAARPSARISGSTPPVIFSCPNAAAIRAWHSDSKKGSTSARAEFIPNGRSPTRITQGSRQCRRHYSTFNE